MEVVVEVDLYEECHVEPAWVWLLETSVEHNLVSNSFFNTSTLRHYFRSGLLLFLPFFIQLLFIFMFIQQDTT